MIITIISPIRFKKEMLHEYVNLSLLGNIVLLPVDVNDMNDFHKAYKDKAFEEDLKALHKKKIDMADEILVMNVGGYMGRGTYEEIGYATVKGKPIKYYQALKEE